MRASGRRPDGPGHHPRRPWIPANLATLILGLIALGAGAGTVAAQDPDSAAPPPEPPPPSTGGWAAYGTVAHPWSTVVAVTVLLPSGSATDGDGRSGTAQLLARTSAEALRDRLDGSTVQVEAEVDRNRTVYRVLTVPDAWPRAYRALEQILFEDAGAPSDGLEEIRASMLATQEFEAGAPILEAEDEIYRMLGGAGSAWARDPRGVPGELGDVTASDLTEWRRSGYERSEAIVTLTGAVDPDEAQRVITGERPVPGRDPVDGLRAVVRDEGTPPRRRAWTAADRIRRVRDVTNGWIAAAYPLDPTTSRTAAEMAAHRIRSVLVTEPPPPGLFSAEVTIEDLPDGSSTVLVRAAVLPEAMESWEERIVGTVGRLAEEPLEEGFLRFHRRRFRNQRLVPDADPGAEGLRMALDLWRDGAVRDLAGEIGALDSAALHGAFQGLGPPRILVFGPDLSGDGTSGPR